LVDKLVLEYKDKSTGKELVKDGVAAVEMGESTDENNRDKIGASPTSPAQIKTKEVINSSSSSTLDNLKKELLKRKELLDKKLLDEEKNLGLCIERKKEHENRIEAIKDKILDLNSFLILAEVK
jgi:hypothetical protein